MPLERDTREQQKDLFKALMAAAMNNKQSQLGKAIWLLCCAKRIVVTSNCWQQMN